MNQLIDLPSEAEHLANVIAGTGTTKQSGVLRPVLARVPETLIADIDAMAKLANKSRSAMVVNLLYVGVQEVNKAADPETAERIRKHASQIAADLQKEQNADREVGEV